MKRVEIFKIRKKCPMEINCSIINGERSVRYVFTPFQHLLICVILFLYRKILKKIETFVSSCDIIAAYRRRPSIFKQFCHLKSSADKSSDWNKPFPCAGIALSLFGGACMHTILHGYVRG